jgi:hypothetical protein
MQVENNNEFRTILKPFGNQYELTQHFKGKNIKNTVYLSKENIKEIFKETCEQDYISNLCNKLEEAL